MEQKIHRIGIVDDHQLILDGLENLLKSEKSYDVAFAMNNAREALGFMEEEPVDLIVTDVAMPDMNGVEFIKKIKEKYPKIKVLVLSTYKTDLIEDEDVDGYLLKESSSQTILKKVKEILSNKPKSIYTDVAKNYHNLSKREKEIVVEIGNGLSSEQIADKLNLSYYTVETHKKNIYLKLNVKTTSELIKKAIHLGIIMN